MQALDRHGRPQTYDRWIDLELKLRDHNFSQWVANMFRHLDGASKNMYKEPRARRTRDEILKQLLHTTGNNLALFLPYYFPSYPDMSPLTLHDYPTNYPLYSMPMGRSITVRGARQLGKSVSLSTRQIMTTWTIPFYRSLYIVPHPSQLRTYRDTMAEMMQGFRFKIPSMYKQNLDYRQMPSGGLIKLMNVLTSAHPLRGNHMDEILWDEYQNMDMKLWGQVQEVISASKYKIQIYAGTSLTTDTALEYKYRESSQSVWMVRCTGCNFENWADADCKHGEKDVMDMVQKKGPCCIKCGKPLQVRGGTWLHRNPDGLEEGNFGLHLPQIVVPARVEKPLNWDNIYQMSLNTNLRSDFYKEKLGIPLESGEREITENHLRAMCMDISSADLQKRAMGGRYYKYIVSGVDWGGSDYDPAKKTKLSYTVHLVLGVNFDGTFDIIRMDQHSGADFREIARRIIDTHKKLNCVAIGSDAGGGAAYNVLLRDRIDPTQHMILKYAGPDSTIIAPIKNTTLENYYSLNRTESITLIYDMIKYGRIRCYKYLEAEALLGQILNLFRSPTSSDSTGATGFTYTRDPAKADDVLHALNMSVVTARCILGEPMFKDTYMQEHVVSMLRAGGAPVVQGIANMQTGQFTDVDMGGFIMG